MSQYFVKSLEEDFHTKTLKGDEKIDFQSVRDIIKTKSIRPNTKSFGQEMRLSTTIIHKNYLKTYRSQGIIFKTSQKPDYVLPFDLVLLTDAKKIVVQYYRIQHNLHQYYRHNLIPGFKKFIFKNISKLVDEFPTPDYVWAEVNKFRIETGHSKLPISKYKLVQYNEAVFTKPVKIEPVAIFGYRKEAREKAKELGLPHFRNAKEFYEKELN